MAYIQLHLFSPSLGMQTEVAVIIPQKDTVGEIGIAGQAKTEQFKTLYLLHGLSDDHSIWLRRTSIERYATEYGICVVMPFGGRSFYTDQKNGEKYYTYISKELPARMSEFFNVSPKREDRFIAGNSMGGYGSLKIALKNSDTFGTAAGLSSVSNIRSERWKEHLENMLGKENYISDDEDLFALAKAKENSPVKPRLYMCCGTEDFLYEENKALSELFKTLDYDYTYEESAGTHCWDYWDDKIQRVLEWMFKENN